MLQRGGGLGGPLTRCKFYFYSLPCVYRAKIMGGLIRTQCMDMYIHIHIYIYIHVYISYLFKHTHTKRQTHTRYITRNKMLPRCFACYQLPNLPYRPYRWQRARRDAEGSSSSCLAWCHRRCHRRGQPIRRRPQTCRPYYHEPPAPAFRIQKTKYCRGVSGGVSSGSTRVSSRERSAGSARRHSLPPTQQRSLACAARRCASSGRGSGGACTGAMPSPPNGSSAPPNGSASGTCATYDTHSQHAATRPAARRRRTARALEEEGHSERLEGGWEGRTS